MRHPRVDEAKKEAETETRYVPVELIREFANALIIATGKNEKDEWFRSKGLGEPDEITRFHCTFPAWQKSSVAFFTTALLNENSEVTDFSSGRMSTPSFDTVEYKRGMTMKAISDGFASFTYKQIPMIMSITVGGSWIHFYLFCNREHAKPAEVLFNQLKTNIDMLPFLRNEKLIIGSYNSIHFLKYPTMSRDTLILPQKIWTTIDRNLFFVAKNRAKLEAQGLDWRRGILIWGLPGTGKTQFGRVLCNEISDMTIIWVTPRCVDDSDDISKIFEIARKLSPTILFFEDLDFFAAKREDYGPSYILGELLTQLDGLNPNDGIFVIGTTNKPGLLDNAIGARPARFDIKIQFDLPSSENREKLYKLFLKDLKGISYRNLASHSDGMTGSHIRESCVRGILSTLHNPSLSLEQAIIEGIKDLRDEALIAPVPKESRGAVA